MLAMTETKMMALCISNYNGTSCCGYETALFGPSQRID
jgi:hypothetical protein